MTTKIMLKRFAVLTPDGRDIASSGLSNQLQVFTTDDANGAGLVLQSSPQAKIVPVEITFTA